MPEDVDGFAVSRVEFKNDGTLAQEGQADDALANAENARTDVLVLAHGWNNDMNQAWSLFTDWMTVIGQAFARNNWTNATGTVGAIGVLWPSKQFAEPAQTAGGGASLEPDVASLIAHIGNLDNVVAPEVQRELTQLAPQLEQNPAARNQFVHAVLGLLADSALDAENHQEIPAGLLSADGDLLSHLGDVDDEDLSARGLSVQGGAAVFDMSQLAPGDATGIAESLGAFVGGVFAGARNLLNYLTYYKMKDRAGNVGRRGLAPLLARLRASQPNLRIHLVGHSFGCRLVTASLLGPPDGIGVTVNSMILLQAAFSHNSFAVRYDGTNDGYFRGVYTPARHVAGPTMITHTRNDTACGLAYPLASFASGTVASVIEIGGPTDPYGALGSNGAMKTPEAAMETMLDVGEHYTGFSDHPIHNLLADKFISGHSDVRGAQVGELIAQTMLSTVP